MRGDPFTTGAGAVIRVELDAEAVAGIRFVVSPVKLAQQLLLKAGKYPHSLPAVWRRRTAAALAEPGLPLLNALVAQAATGYVPDFISPEPAGFDENLDDQLHRVATAPADRIAYETAIILDGHPWCLNGNLGQAPAMVEAIQRGEHDLPERVAAELKVFWDRALAAHWPPIRERMHADIALRGAQAARDGFAIALSGLAPSLRWRDGGLDLDVTADEGSARARGLLLTPTLFRGPISFAIDPPDAIRPRLPTITYPIADAVPPQVRPRPPRLGATRALLLQELTTPASTTELARRLDLTPGTISHHLQALYREGLVQRTRQAQTVIYQRISDPG
ncbi:MAG TPA: winged helix-turn-helix domain-containing protein [Spirillospora sp.]|nr:winged helix-turn-helix domain-containing protein [Spirillospora sp.]